MPQPLKRKTRINFDPAAIEKHPNLAAQIVSISNQWNSIEEMMSMLLSQLLKTDRRMGIALYFSVASLPLRLELIRKAARLMVGSDRLAIIEDICDEVRKRSQERNKIIHSQWATSADFPDALIRAEPATYRAAWISEYERISDAISEQISNESFPVDISVRVTEGAEIYCESDFVQTSERLEALFTRIVTFMLRWSEERIQHV